RGQGPHGLAAVADVVHPDQEVELTHRGIPPRTDRPGKHDPARYCLPGGALLMAVGLMPLVLLTPDSAVPGQGDTGSESGGAGWCPRPHCSARCQEVAAKAFTMPAPKKVVLDGPPVHCRTRSAGPFGGDASPRPG